MKITPLKFGQYYHVYNRGNNRQNIFLERRNYPYFLQLYIKYLLPVATTFAYCLLPNHFHFLLRTYTKEEQRAYWFEQQRQQIGPLSESGPISPAKPKPFKLTEPSRAFNNMFIAYTRAVNKATGRTGALFERPFGRKLVNSDAYFQTLIVYIHQNPQHHRFVNDFRDWKWASYGAFNSSGTSHIKRAEAIEWFGDMPSFLEAHQREADAKFIEPFIGDDTFD